MSAPLPTNRAAFLGLFLVVLLALAPSASAAPPTTFDIESRDFDIGSPVYVNITGPGGMAISIRITDTGGIILSGRDTNLDATGNYSFVWSPSDEGSYNVTVIWATGFTLTKSVLIQDKVTSREIGDIYLSMFALERRLREALAEVQRLTNIAIALAAVAAVATTVAAIYVRNAAPRPKTFFEGYIEEVLDAKFREIESKKRGGK